MLDCLFVLNKLHNVSASLSPIIIRETVLVTVKFVHVLKIFISQTNNNDRTWPLCQVNQLFFHLGHVMDYSIGNNQQHVVNWTVLQLHNVLFELVQKRSKVGGARELNRGQSGPIDANYAFCALNKWLHRVTCQREAMVGCSLSIWFSTKPINGEEFIRVILLQETANLVKGLFVLVLRAHKVQAVFILNVTIRCCVVQTNC